MPSSPPAPVAATQADGDAPGAGLAPPRPRPLPVKVRITALWHWTANLISFRVARPDGFEFVPGQFARLGLPASPGEDGKQEWRAFSIVSGRHEKELEFYAVLVPEGAFSSMLKPLLPGDAIWIEDRGQGFMTTECFQGGTGLWMLATGTGLGPFLSILQEPDIWNRYRDLVLVHCVRHAGDFSYGSQLQDLQRSQRFGPAQLHLIQTVTREPATQVSPNCLQGRITQLLANGTLERTAGFSITPEASRVMLCGNPEMISETRKLLRERGMQPCRRQTPGQYLSENYW